MSVDFSQWGVQQQSPSLPSPKSPVQSTGPGIHSGQSGQPASQESGERQHAGGGIKRQTASLPAPVSPVQTPSEPGIQVYADESETNAEALQDVAKDMKKTSKVFLLSRNSVSDCKGNWSDALSDVLQEAHDVIFGFSETVGKHGDQIVQAVDDLVKTDQAAAKAIHASHTRK
ncbi:hypothetical protein OZX72_06860 [Bifidobacterium sp. ESL0769]|uniref:hypothetical protein n=1 Tax=Bifidobacterium sp. ESL0769 TaxID=2983229 RepID=UPI0023F8C5E1|nr:hypothetical protein [Bifidobacterium sp. ESL0769]WEV66967.1 hypothetical protein OZX72_06860 [Bifidobacterium sp. ESL0769]